MSREIMQQALDALLHMCNTTKAQNDYNAKIVDKTLVTLETALAQPEQAPPKREWVGLSVNETRDFFESKLTREELITEISEFLEEKNT